MKETSKTGHHIEQEGHRLKQHFFRRYQDYIIFFSSIAIGLLVVGFMINGFLDLLESLENEELGNFDDRITLWALSFKSDGFTTFIQGLTHFGDRIAYTILAFLMGIYLYERKGNLVFTFQAVAVLAIAGGLSFWLKDLIERPRPEAAHELGISTFSFPSGHSMSAIAFYGFLIYLSWRIYHSRLKKIGLTLLFSAMILGIGFSRIYLQVHYPSDVLAGFAAGGACLIIFIIAFSAIRFWHHKKGEEPQPDDATAEEQVPRHSDAA